MNQLSIYISFDTYNDPGIPPVNMYMSYIMEKKAGLIDGFVSISRNFDQLYRVKRMDLATRTTEEYVRITFEDEIGLTKFLMRYA